MFDLIITIFGIILMILGIGIIVLALHIVYEKQEKWLLGKLENLWINVDDCIKRRISWIERQFFRFLYYYKNIMNWVFGEKKFSFKSIGISFWVVCLSYAVHFVVLALAHKGNPYETYLYGINIKGTLHILGMSLRGPRATLGQGLLLFFFVLLFTAFILLPKFVKPRFWVPTWIVPYILICFFVWSKIGCYHETVINNIGVIKDFSPLPIPLRLIVLLSISILPYICIVFFALDINKYIDDQTKVIKPWKILLKIFIYLVNGMIIIALTTLGISLVSNNYGAVFIFGPLLFQGIIIPIIFLLLLPIISMVFIYFIKWLLAFFDRLLYMLPKYYPINVKVGVYLFVLGLAIVSRRNITEILSFL